MMGDVCGYLSNTYYDVVYGDEGPILEVVICKWFLLLVKHLLHL